jgi:hypothetical protein
MRRFCIVLAAVAIVSLAIIGCGSSDDGAAGETPAAGTSATTAPAGDAWTTVATMRSSDPQDMEGILISEPFTATGDVRLVLDMPKGGKVDGVIGVIIPADKSADAQSILGAIPDGASVTLIPSSPTKVVSGLDGTYVFVNSVPTAKAWSLDLQTRP